MAIQRRWTVLVCSVILSGLVLWWRFRVMASFGVHRQEEIR